MPRYELKEGTSNKFWEIELQGSSFTTTYGRIGSDGQSTVKEFKNEAAAKKEYDKLVAEKTGKGYQLIRGGGAGRAAKASAAKKPSASKVEVKASAGTKKAGPSKKESKTETKATAGKAAPKASAAKPRAAKPGAAMPSAEKASAAKPSAAKPSAAKPKKASASKTSEPTAATPKASPAKAAQGTTAAPVQARDTSGRVRYELNEGSSRKFWEIELEGRAFTTTYGRIGTVGHSARKEFASPGEAKKEHDKLAAEKEKKGYKRVNGGSAAKVSNPELEAALVEDLENEQSWLVYGDWLQSQGDPRGELLALQHARSKETDKRKANALLAQEEKLMAQHESALLGRMAEHRKCFKFDWEMGFIKSARVATDYQTIQKIATLVLLERLLDHPSTRFLQSLTLGIFTFEENNYQAAIDLLVKRRGPETLRSLFIGDFDSEETELSWSALGDASKLYGALPQLRSLILRSGSMTLGKIVAPELREFAVRTGGLSAASIKSICTANWPNLERLEIWFGSDDYGAEGDIKSIQAILDGRGIPKVRHLGLMNAMFTDDIVKALPKSTVLKQLETLDLSMGCLSVEGVETILKNQAAFQHLARLDVSDNAIAAGAEKKLAGVCREVVYRGQDPERVADEDFRYTSVGE